MSNDMVFFTSLSSEEKRTRTASLPAGSLNQLSHTSLRAVLENSDEYGERWPMSPFNAPSRDELGAPKFVDEEGLNWTYRQVQTLRLDTAGHPVRLPAVELICLDDSALRKEVLLADGSVLDNFLAQYGSGAISELVTTVKSMFLQYTPPRRR
jgi:hypothetical protein